MDGLDTGTQFNFEYAPGTTLEQMIGFEMAGQFWSEYLADNVSINIFVEMTDTLPENVVGGALPGIEDNVRYETFRNKLTGDITSSVDRLIDRNQQNDLDKFTAYFQAEYNSNGYYKVDNNQYLKMTRANAKALDIINPHHGGLDGYILMRDLDGVGDGDLNSIRWNYDYSNNSVANNSLDFLSVAIHEIGHTLGFVSGLDQANWLAGKRNVNAGNEDDYYNGLIGKLNNATPIDMLRFSSGSNYASGSGDSWIDMSVGGNPFLSFDGGQTTVAYFATGESADLGGDGYQASHWKRQDNALGIMDPVLGTGQRREITNLDKQLFDAIGWDIRTENADLQTIHNEAKVELAAKIGVSDWWMETNSVTAAKILTPDYLDKDLDLKDDRGEQLNTMIVNSGEVYNWGWKGFWWGWKGFWWGWKGYWQNTNAFQQDGFWQNLSWQTVRVSNTSQSTTESSELDLTGIFDNTISGNRERDYNPFDRQQNKNLSKYEEDDSLLSNPKQQNREDYKLDLSDRNWVSKGEENSQDLLSGDLIFAPLSKVIGDDVPLVMPIY